VRPISVYVESLVGGRTWVVSRISIVSAAIVVSDSGAFG
jgi:hypothetical protein